MFRTTAKLIIIVLLVLLPASSVFAIKVERLARVSPSSGRTIHLEVAAGSALIKFKVGVSSSAAALSLPAGFTVLEYSGVSDWVSVRLPVNMSVSVGLMLLKNIPSFEFVEPNRVYRAKRVPNDPFLASQYALSQVQAFGAWEYETGASSHTTVAFIDTGIDSTHPEINGKMTGTSRAFDPDTGAGSDNQPSTPACNHATRAAGVAAAVTNNGAGISGMSWGAGIISLKVFDSVDCYPDCAQGTCGTTEIAIADAIADITNLHNTAALGKVVLNMSLGSVGSCSPYLQSRIDTAVAKGLILFAAAGNEGIGAIDSPANCDGVIAVGATDSKDFLAYFSNTETLMMTKGIAAPGVGLYTTDMGGGYASASGTSFSSPMVAGLAALLWSAKPNKTADDVWKYIRDSADDLGAPGPDSDFGFGRINAMKALRLAMTGTTQFAGTKKAVAYPNPFRPGTHRLVTFTVPEDIMSSDVQVKVYTAEGEQVKKLDGLAWDGKNEAGADVASGVYIFRVKTGKDAAVGRFALLK